MGNKIEIEMSQSKPIQGRPLLVELIYEMNTFMPLNGLIKCCKANRTLKELGILRAQKVHAKLISLYFADISTLAIWSKQWARQMAEVRAKILRHTSNRLTFDLLAPVVHDLDQFRNLLRQCLDKIKEIINADKAGNILDGFNFPPAFQNELRQIRASHIEQALAPAEFELSQWRLQNIPSLNEMLTHLLEDSFELLSDLLLQQFLLINRFAEICVDLLEVAAEFLNYRS